MSLDPEPQTAELSPSPPTATQRLKLTIAYRGSSYHGWQRQVMPPTWKGPRNPGDGLPTVQEFVEKAVRGVVNHPVNVVGSSRTDSGVHAKAQVAHFDTTKVQVPLDGLRRAINHRLPDDILIRSITPVPREFDAIASTLRKRYQYFIWHTTDRPLFFFDLAWHRWQPLDIDAMRAAAAHLVGEHDFASFSKPGHRRTTTVRTIYSLDLTFRAPKLVIGIEGSGFLWQMVRIIVGTLAEVGLGRFTPEAMKAMLAARDRRAAGSTAPPQGLYLHWVKTDDTGRGNAKDRLEPTEE